MMNTVLVRFYQECAASFYPAIENGMRHGRLYDAISAQIASAGYASEARHQMGLSQAKELSQ